MPEEDDLMERQPHRDMTSQKTKFTGKLPHMEMTSQVNDLTGKPPQMKTTTQEDDLKEDNLTGR